jgi:multidrug resistance efflux pump
MTTPAGAADERERLIARIYHMCPEKPVPCGECVATADMLRADAETIQSLQAWKELQLAAAVELRAQLAAQSAELDRVKKDAERYRWLRENPNSWPIVTTYQHIDDQGQRKFPIAFDAAIDAALAAQSSANRGGEGKCPDQ